PSLSPQSSVLSPEAAPQSSRKKPVKRVPLPVQQNTYHRLRKRIHILCTLIFIALPFFNVMRFDIPRERFYFLGYELWINEFGILFFSLMFLMFVVAAASMLYGRIYCGYLCPQMIFSEAATDLHNRLNKFVSKRFAKLSASARKWLANGALYGLLGVASVFLSFVFIAYFVEPRDLLQRLLALDVKTAGGICGAATTLVTFLDFAFVRQKFCTTVCPYGYLQGMLSDKNTLLVHYRDEEQVCIECKKCVKICEMGIDIRKSPFQIECVHCGECIDACTEILGRMGQPGLIHYAWGEQGESLDTTGVPWYRKLGLRDAKRIVVMLVLLFYASGLLVVLSLRKPVFLKIMPNRTTLFQIAPTGEITNTFRLTLGNRSSQAATVTLALKDLSSGRIDLPSPVIALKPGETLQQEFAIAVKPETLAPGVNHFQIIGTVVPGNHVETFAETFITPMERKSK
ncbi:MAG: 4Fe-4S binding protein, partial [Blastocatellia bacterium]|nr:4Fe-4S binding protein [Blastocatellia bacterium]